MRIFFLILIFFFTLIIQGQPKWTRTLPSPENDTYYYAAVTAISSSVDEGKRLCKDELYNKYILYLEAQITINSREAAIDKQSFSSLINIVGEYHKGNEINGYTSYMLAQLAKDSRGVNFTEYSSGGTVIEQTRPRRNELRSIISTNIQVIDSNEQVIDKLQKENKIINSEKDVLKQYLDIISQENKALTLEQEKQQRYLEDQEAEFAEKIDIEKTGLKLIEAIKDNYTNYKNEDGVIDWDYLNKDLVKLSTYYESTSNCDIGRTLAKIYLHFLYEGCLSESNKTFLTKIRMQCNIYVY